MALAKVSGGRPHGTTQEAGYDVGQSGGRTHGTTCRHNIISKLKCGATLFCDFIFCLVCGRFIKKRKKKKIMFRAP